MRALPRADGLDVVPLQSHQFRMFRELDLDADNEIGLSEWNAFWDRYVADHGNGSCELRIQLLRQHMLDSKGVSTATDLSKKSKQYAKHDVSPELRKLMNRVFVMLDTDKSGKLDRAYGKMAVQSDEEGSELMKKIYHASDELLSLREWSAFWESFASGAHVIESEMKLRRLESTITRYQLKHSTKHTTCNLRPANGQIDHLINQLFQLLDKDASGVLVPSDISIVKDSAGMQAMLKATEQTHNSDIGIEEWLNFWRSTEAGSDQIVEMRLKKMKNDMRRPAAGKKVQRRRMRQHNNSAIERLAVQVFSMLDEDKSGTLLMAEVKIALKSDEDTLKMMNEIDVEDDDDIELDEWKNYWQSSDSGSENSAEMKLKQLKATLLRIQHGVA